MEEKRNYLDVKFPIGFACGMAAFVIGIEVWDFEYQPVVYGMACTGVSWGVTFLINALIGDLE